MKIGFTGSRHGMTKVQHARATGIMLSENVKECLHGGCVSADAEFHKICLSIGSIAISVFRGHPTGQPNYTKYWGKLASSINVAHIEPAPFLERNRRIVNNCDLLIATPSTDSSKGKGGTWYTIGYAKDNDVPVLVLRR